MEFKTAGRMDALPFSGIRAVMEKANAMQAAGENIVHLEIGRPDFDTPEKIKKAAEESLRAAIAEWENAHNGAHYEAANVMVTIGVSEATWCAMDAYLEKGDEVLVPNPVWLNYIHVPTALGATPVTYSLKEENDFQIDFEELESKITERTKMIVVVDPSNPTGGVFSRETMERLAEICVKHNLIAISDEIYEQLLYDGEKHTSLATLPGMAERTIKLGGFSKAYSMTGWRIGYLCAPKEIISAVVRVHQYTVTCASSFAQDASVTALKECDEDVEIMRQEYQKRKDYLVKELNSIEGISTNHPTGAFYIFVNIKSLGKTSMEMAEYLLENAKIALVPGSAFGSEGEGYLRISYATSMDQLVEACKRIRKAVEDLRAGK